MLAVPDQFVDGRFLTDLGALVAGVVEEHLVELGTQHLPRLRDGFAVVAIEEIERLRNLSRGCTNWTLYFFTKREDFIFGIRPSRFKGWKVNGISDSPM